MIGAIKRHLPWWAKIGAKLVLSRVPAAYAVWQRMGLFRHGHMDTAQYALAVEFRDSPDAALNVCGFDVLLRKPLDPTAAKNLAVPALDRM